MSVVPVPSLHPPALRPVRDPGRGAEAPSPDMRSPDVPSPDVTPPDVPSPETSSSGTPSPEEQLAAETPSSDEQPAGIEVIRIVGWPDPVIDRLGYDPRSLYVETFWLGILGPTTLVQ
jgi:hypothetical protein